MSFSSLFVSGRYGSHTVHKIFSAIKPKIKLQTIFSPKCLSEIEDSINRRKGNPGLTFSFDSVKNAIEPAQQLLQVNDKIEKMKKLRDEELENVKNVLNKSPKEVELSKLRLNWQLLNETREEMYDLEEKVIPIVLNLPCKLRNDVPSINDSEQVVKSANLSKLNKRPSFKQLDYRQLAYINESMFASLVGPDSIYQLGKLAELQYSLEEHFSDLLRKNSFSDFCGLDFVKDAVFEACNARHEKDYVEDPFKIGQGYSEDHESQHIHAVGDSSLESFYAFLSKKRWKGVTQVERFFSAGSTYEVNNESRLVQKNVVQSLSAHPDTENEPALTDEEVENVLNVLWKGYIDLDIPVKVTKAPAPFLKFNEYFRYDISIYVKSLSQWVQVGYIANNINYVSNRIGLDDCQTVTSLAIDIRPVVMSIVEFSQQSDGTFTLPKSCNYFEKCDDETTKKMT